MGLFNRNKRTRAGTVQIPDELAQRAQIEYGNSSFPAAANLYADAVDKLHTMYVIGQCQYRQPSQSDSSITQGLASAVGAALAMDPSVQMRSLIVRSIGYLSEILQTPQAKLVSNVYERTMSELSRLYETASN